MPFGDPDELKAEKALVFRTLTQALADLIGLVEHGRKRVLSLRGDQNSIDDPKERAELLAEVVDWFAEPDDAPSTWSAPISVSIAEAWSCEVRKYLANPKRHAIVPHWRRLKVEDVIEIRLKLLQGERASALARHYRVDSSVIPQDSHRPALEAGPQDGSMTFYRDERTELRHGDCLDPTDGLASLPDKSADVILA
jgi:hypothetical protein